LLGAASSAALVVGFAVLLSATTEEAVYRASAPLLMAIQLTRAPLLVPLGAYQGVAITYVLRHRDDGLRPLARIAGAVVGLGVVAACLAALLGPWLMATVLGEGYRVDALLLFALTLAAAGLALLTLTGAAALAVNAHRAFSAGWLSATAAATLLLLVPASIETRAVLSLAVGPVLGILVHVVAVRRAFAGRR
jgi:O-antigen/teichoic acid export membrane protein